MVLSLLPGHGLCALYSGGLVLADGDGSIGLAVLLLEGLLVLGLHAHLVAFEGHWECVMEQAARLSSGGREA